MSWYSDDNFDIYMTLNRMFGPYAPACWLLILCNVLTPQALWFKRIRTNIGGALRHLAARQCRDVDGTLRHCHHQSASRFSAVGLGDFPWHALGLDDASSVRSGSSLTLLFLFLRFLPAISISEMRDLVHEKSEGKP